MYATLDDRDGVYDMNQSLLQRNDALTQYNLGMQQTGAELSQYSHVLQR